MRALPPTTRGLGVRPLYRLRCGGGGASRPPLVRGGICVAGAEANRRRLRVGRGIERERNKRSLIKRGRAAAGPQTAPGNRHSSRVQGSRYSDGKADERPKFAWDWDACAAFKVDNVRHVVRPRGLLWPDVCRIPQGGKLRYSPVNLDGQRLCFTYSAVIIACLL